MKWRGPSFIFAEHVLKPSLQPLAISPEGVVEHVYVHCSAAADVSRLTLSSIGFNDLSMANGLSGLTSAATG
jgi:hypothetical protein